MINITSEPKDETYEALLKFAVKRCHSFSLVWRHEIRIKSADDEMFRELAPFLNSESETSKWPGTKLQGEATVRHYKLTRQVLPILFRSEGLYGWLHPKFPEDLALYLSNGENWLASIAHENMSWITDTQLTIKELRQAVPNLQIRQR